MARIEGVLSADLNFASGTLLVEYDPAHDPRAAVVRSVESSGHGAESLDDAEGAPARPRPWLDRNRAEIATVGSGAFAALGIAAEWFGASEALATACFAIAIVFGGVLVWKRALVSVRARVLDMNVLMTVAVAGAVALGEWGEGATVYFLFALGGLLESRSLERTRNSIRDLMDLTPARARVVRDGRIEEVDAAALRAGDTLVVRPGERVPADGIISTGATALDESPITGESVPVDKAEGAEVFAGTLNTTGLIEVAVTAAASDSTLARIVHLVEEAQAAKAPSQQFVDRFSRWYTPAAVALAAAVALVPPLLLTLGGAPSSVWAEWIHRGLVVLVVSCPCALVISTPVSIVSAITRATRDGVLVKGGVHLETAAKIKAVAFDKTGTLTRGTPAVVDVAGFDATDAAAVLAVAGALEAHSNHPIARAVVRAAGPSARPGVVTGVAEVAGQGISGSIDGVAYRLGSPAAAAAELQGSPAAAEWIAAAERAGRTALVLTGGGAVQGAIAVADEVRAEAREALARLHAGGVEHTVMLTGDNERVAEGVAAQLGLSSYLARLLPAAKTEAVGTLRQRYGAVAMVGDGINDAPALAAADIGIAMGAAGSDTALEVADVALMRDDLSALAGFFALGRRTVRTIVVNVTFSIAVKVVFLALALAGMATLWMAVFADTGVALLVILNGMRLLRRVDA